MDACFVLGFVMCLIDLILILISFVVGFIVVSFVLGVLLIS